MGTFIFLSGLGGGGGTEITVVDDYAALLALPPTADTFYWCQNSQGTAWLPGSVGGTYYPKGVYYCFTTSPLVIEYIETPYQATQVEVDAGTNDNKFITPKTFNDSAQLASKANLSGATFTGSISATNLSNTNTGDETQSSILSKLGFYIFKSLTSSATVTGTAETIVGSFDVGNGKFSSNDLFNFDCDFIRGTRAGSCTLKAYLSTVDNNISTAVLIATGTTNNNTVGYITQFDRYLKIKSNVLTGFQASTAANSQKAIGATVSNQSNTFVVANSYFLIITNTFTSASDTGYLNSMTIKNF